MKTNKDHRLHKQKLKWGQCALALLVVITLLQPFSVVEAGWFDRVKDIYQLPDHVEDIQQQYDETKRQLNEQMDKLADQKELLAQQQDKITESIKQSLEREEQLIAQNRQLQEQNQGLQQRLMVMEEAAKAKEARNRKITIMIITAVSLVLGYFLLGRLFRVAVWRRHKGRLGS
ncbi:hypothetical protein D3C73_908950 [compost metagenome]